MASIQPNVHFREKEHLEGRLIPASANCESFFTVDSTDESETCTLFFRSPEHAIRFAEDLMWVAKGFTKRSKNVPSAPAPTDGAASTDSSV